MNLKDKEQLKFWLTYSSLEEVEKANPIGIVGNIRFTENARRAFILLWSWSDYRFEGKAGQDQERYYNKCGRSAFLKRKNRALKIINDIKKGNF